MKEISSNEEWKKWGEIDPLYGVATWENKEKTGSQPWTDQEFYQLGASDWNDFAKHWEKYGVTKASCLEIGCGAGRITKQLAAYFQQVHAIDVSEDMIKYAQKHIELSSVHFHLSNGVTIPLEDRSVSAVFSTHVFQHFDSLEVADRYFAEVSRTLQSGGTLMIHLPIYRWPSSARLFNALFSIHKTIGNVRASGKRLLMRYGLVKPLMRGTSYPMEYFYNVLPKYGFEDIEVNFFITKSNNDPHPFVFARKKLSAVSHQLSARKSPLMAHS